MTSKIASIGVRSLRHEVSAEEWQTRVELAACYRLAAHLNWATDLANHLSARVPGEEDAFLLNPYGLMFHEVTASSLIKVDMEGNVLTKSPFRVNRGGHAIHSGVYLARRDVFAALHTHTKTGMAISMLKCGLVTLSQTGVRFHKRIAYHDFAGPAGIMDDAERIGADLGPHLAMIMRNHGLLTVGRSIGEAFVVMFRLEQSIEAQLLAQSTGQELLIPEEEVCDKAALDRDRMNDETTTDTWKAWIRVADQIDPSYRE